MELCDTSQQSTNSLAGTRTSTLTLPDRLLSLDISWARQIQFWLVAFQFGLLILVIRAFSLESKAFLHLVVFTFFGFLVHHFLPLRWRIPFFAALCVCGMGIVLGVTNSLWVLGIGGVLITLAHLPIATLLRVALIVGAGGLLAVLRVKQDFSPIPATIWPILGSMFMFRMLIYLYDLKHQAAPFSFSRAVAYFFMLPNACFPMFPLVDYKTFCASHYNDEPIRIYQKGLWWCLHGVIHLLLYRMIYQNFLIDPASVVDARGAAQFLVANYLIYLKFTGAFHLIVGMLHLFGFNLPRIFHYWMIATGFTDFWRRVNIYWKNFIQKQLFNPSYFWLKRRVSGRNALALSTLYAFALTWALHSYQWFWIRGAFPVRWQDLVFYTILGSGVLANMFLEMKFGRPRTLSQPHISMATRVRRAVQAVGMFAMICVMWAFWNADSPQEWWAVVSALGNLTSDALALITAIFLGVGIASILLGQRSPDESFVTSAKVSDMTWKAFWRATVATMALTGLILLVGKNPLVLSFSPRLVEIVDNLRSPDRLSDRDTKILERGYYEDLTDVTRFNDELANLYVNRPADWNKNTAVQQREGHYPPYDFIPSVSVPYKGATLKTNQWGMHDRKYSLEKPENVYRIAILGSSHTVGIGVDRSETYENVVEDRLNREYARDSGRRYEILNFSVSGYGPICGLTTFEKKVLDFKPDAVINVGMDDITWVVNEMVHATNKQLLVPYEPLRTFIRDADVQPGAPRLIAEQRLRPLAREMLGWVYQRYLDLCQEHNVAPLATVLPRPEDVSKSILDADVEQTEMMKEAGFTFLDTYEAYAQVEDYPTLWIRPWDRHPSKKGHALLAEQLYNALTQYLDSIGHRQPGDDKNLSSSAEDVEL